MAQKRKSLKKSFRKSNRSTRRKSKTNKRKSRKIRGGEDQGTKLLNKVGQIEGQLNKLYSMPNDNSIKKEIRKLVDEIITHNSKCMFDNCKNNTSEAYIELLRIIDNTKIKILNMLFLTLFK